MENIEKYSFIANEYLKKNVVTFFGAGASRSSGLPVAWELVRDILKHLCQHFPNSGQVSEAIDQLSDNDQLPRFETLVGRLVSECGDQAYSILDVFEYGEPNASCKVVAHMMNSGYQNVHLTTNFDLLLEKAIDRPVRSVFEPRIQDQTDEPVIVHLHGGTAFNHSNFEEIISTLDGVLRPLPDPFKSCMESVLRNKIVLLVGYSGEDDDIRPILQKYTDQNRIWTINPSVIPNSKIFTIVGDRSRIIEADSDTAFIEIYRALIAIVSTDNSQNFLDGLRQESDKPEIDGILRNITSLLNPQGAIKTVLITLLDAGLYESAEFLLAGAKLPPIDEFCLRAGLFEQTQHKHLLPDLNTFVSIKENKQLSFRNLVDLGSAHAKIGKVTDALYFFKLADEKSNLDDVITYLMFKMGYANTLVFSGRDIGDKNKALSHIDEALKHAKKYPEIRSSLLNTKGVVLQQTKAEHAEIRECYLEALRAAEASQIPIRICRVLVNLAELSRTNPQTINDTIRFLSKARKLARLNGLNNVIAHSFSGMMYAYTQQRRNDRALVEIKNALAFFEKHITPNHVKSGTLIDIAVSYIGLGDYHSAARICSDAMSFIESEESGNIHRMSMAFANYIEALVHLKDVQEVKKCLIRVPEILKKTIDSNFSYGGSWLAIAAAKGYLMLNNIEKASSFVELAKDQNSISDYVEVSVEIDTLSRNLARGGG